LRRQHQQGAAGLEHAGRRANRPRRVVQKLQHVETEHRIERSVQAGEVF
jgi:hypothetical protein